MQEVKRPKKPLIFFYVAMILAKRLTSSKEPTWKSC